MSKTTKTTKKSTTKVSAKSTRTTKKAAMEADAKAKVAKLKEMEADHNYSQRGRKALLIVSLFLNLTFIVTIYAILQNQMHQ